MGALDANASDIFNQSSHAFSSSSGRGSGGGLSSRLGKSFGSGSGGRGGTGRGRGPFTSARSAANSNSSGYMNYDDGDYDDNDDLDDEVTTSPFKDAKSYKRADVGNVKGAGESKITPSCSVCNQVFQSFELLKKHIRVEGHHMNRADTSATSSSFASTSSAAPVTSSSIESIDNAMKKKRDQTRSMTDDQQQLLKAKMKLLSQRTQDINEKRPPASSGSSGGDEGGDISSRIKPNTNFLTRFVSGMERTNKRLSSPSPVPVLVAGETRKTYSSSTNDVDVDVDITSAAGLVRRVRERGSADSLRGLDIISAGQRKNISTPDDDKNEEDNEEDNEESSDVDEEDEDDENANDDGDGEENANEDDDDSDDNDEDDGDDGDGDEQTNTLQPIAGTPTFLGGVSSMQSSIPPTTSHEIIRRSLPQNVSSLASASSRPMSSSYSSRSAVANVGVDEESATMRGTCEEMCPENERIKRIDQSDVNRLEQEHPGRPGVYSKDMMIKEFKRSSADYDLLIPQNIRTPVTLLRTVRYIENEIMQKDEQYDSRFDEKPKHDFGGVAPRIHIYLFIWNRFRMIAKDFSLQTGRVAVDEAWIECHERMCRYLVLMNHSMLQEDEFNAGHHQQNEELMNNIFKTLSGIYEDESLSHLEMPNKAEFVSYFVLLQLGNSGESMKLMQKQKKYILETDKMRFAAKALSSFKRHDYAMYFKMMRQGDPFQASLMHKFVGAVRLQAIKMMVKTYFGGLPCFYPLAAFTKLFLFHNEDEAIAFTDHCGITLVDKAGEYCIEMSNQYIQSLLPRDQNDLPIAPPTLHMGGLIDTKFQSVGLSKACKGVLTSSRLFDDEAYISGRNGRSTIVNSRVSQPPLLVSSSTIPKSAKSANSVVKPSTVASSSLQPSLSPAAATVTSESIGNMEPKLTRSSTDKNLDKINVISIAQDQMKEKEFLEKKGVNSPQVPPVSIANTDLPLPLIGSFSFSTTGTVPSASISTKTAELMQNQNQLFTSYDNAPIPIPQKASLSIPVDFKDTHLPITSEEEDAIGRRKKMEEEKEIQMQKITAANKAEAIAKEEGLRIIEEKRKREHERDLEKERERIAHQEEQARVDEEIARIEFQREQQKEQVSIHFYFF